MRLYSRDLNLKWVWDFDWSITVALTFYCLYIVMMTLELSTTLFQAIHSLSPTTSSHPGNLATKRRKKWVRLCVEFVKNTTIFTKLCWPKSVNLNRRSEIWSRPKSMKQRLRIVSSAKLAESTKLWTSFRRSRMNTTRAKWSSDSASIWFIVWTVTWSQFKSDSMRLRTATRTNILSTRRNLKGTDRQSSKDCRLSTDLRSWCDWSIRTTFRERIVSLLFSNLSTTRRLLSRDASSATPGNSRFVIKLLMTIRTRMSLRWMRISSHKSSGAPFSSQRWIKRWLEQQKLSKLSRWLEHKLASQMCNRSCKSSSQGKQHTLSCFMPSATTRRSLTCSEKKTSR